MEPKSRNSAQNKNKNFAVELPRKVASAFNSFSCVCLSSCVSCLALSASAQAFLDGCGLVFLDVDVFAPEMILRNFVRRYG